MEMKKLLNIISEGKKITEEHGSMMSNATAIPSTPPVTMSLNLNAQGIDQIKDLLNLMNAANSPLAPGVLGQKPMPIIPPMPTVSLEPMLAPRTHPIIGASHAGPTEPDMRDLIKIASSPEAEDDTPDTDGAAPKKEMQAVADQVQNMASELKNSPANTGMNRPTYGSMDDAIPSGDDLHKKKGTYPRVNGGDNPMAMEQLKRSLFALYKEIKEER